MQEDETKLVITGVNFKKAALDIRNKFALTTENIKHIYEETLPESFSDFFILSTCNRTEIYSTSCKAEELAFLLSTHTRISNQEAEEYLFVKTGDEAVNHLFHVASGLDSQILGDYEIIGQLKSAFVLAKSYKRTSGYMEKLINTSLQVSRQVRQRTSISDGTTSISYAVIQLLRQRLGQEEPMNVCLMGLGKIGTLTLKNLRHYLPQHTIQIVNRNETKAEVAAKEYGVEMVKLEHQDKALQNADVLIIATGADHPIITTEQVRTSSIKYIFDLSVPSNIEDSAKLLPNITFYTIDDLSKIVNNTLSNRKEQIPVAEEIVTEYLTELKSWQKRREEYTSKVTR